MGRSLILAVVSALAASHNCVHDAIISHPDLRVVRGDQLYEHGGRRLQTSTFAPIRIRPLYTSLTADRNMTQSLVNFLQNKLFPAAIARWQSALSVQPVTGPLFAHRDCTSYFQSTTPYRCASYSEVTPCANVGDGISLNFASTYIGEDVVYSTNGDPTVVPATGPGLADADFGVFVTAQVLFLDIELFSVLQWCSLYLFFSACRPLFPARKIRLRM